MSGQVLWQVRDVILSIDGEVDPFEGQTIQGVDSVATGPEYSLLTNYGWTMRLAYRHWENGEREMRALDCNSTEHRMHDICNRLRVSVYESERDPAFSWMELMQARMEEGSNRPTKKKATSLELLEGTRGMIVPGREFKRLGASFGTRQELMGESGRHRTYLCTTFPSNDAVVPAVAFVLTRVLPVWNRYSK